MREIKIGIYSHQDDFLGLLYDSNREFEGQITAPQITINSNGGKTLTFSMPLMIYDRRSKKYIDNPKWNYVTNHYKIRVEEDKEINEFVMQTYNESRNESDEMMMDVSCISLAEFELSQVGYQLVFNSDSLRMFAEGDDPNDPYTEQIGAYDATIDFWERKLLGYSKETDENGEPISTQYGWKYKVDSYYEIENNPVTGEQWPERNRNKIYETNMIIDYVYDGTNYNPVYANDYTEKQRIITLEKSNVWNGQSELCSKFEVWPEYKIIYDENGKIAEKWIILRNDIPEDSLFTLRYSKNEKSITRNVDSSQIVTKMYVNSLSNENVDSGLVTISDNDANFTREDYILDLDWYMGKIEDEELNSDTLIDPNLVYHFPEDTQIRYPYPLIDIDCNDTETILEEYKNRIRTRNLNIEWLAQEVARKETEYIDYCSEKEFKQASRESALEQYNTIMDEWALCPQGVQIKYEDRMYAYNIDGNVIVSFSEKGILENYIARDKGIVIYPNSAVNLIDNIGNEVTDATKIQWEIYEREPITGAVTKIRLTNVRLGSNETYACFSIDLLYNPLYFYECLKRYWKAKADEYEARINVLGITPDEGGIDAEIQGIYTDGILTGNLIMGTFNELQDLKEELYQAKLRKEKEISSVEKLFYPYIREGYWEDTDYGVYANSNNLIEDINAEEEPLYNDSINKVVWTDEYVCFKIPNLEVATYYPNDPSTEGGKLNARLKLYDIIDINTIEVMTSNPANENLDMSFKNYVKGTDFNIEYGFVTNSEVTSEGDLLDNTQPKERGIFLKFYNSDTLFRAKNWAVNQDTELFVRAKARGCDNYIFAGTIMPEYMEIGKRKAYCQAERTITIEDENVILSSIQVSVTTGQLNYKLENKDTNPNENLQNSFVILPKSVYENTYSLIYGTDYYVFKEEENGKTVAKIHLNETTNVPMMTKEAGIAHIPAWFKISYDKDITTKFYYNDALEVMEDFKKPQVSYDIAVQDLNHAIHPERDYSSYKPYAGTRIPIYDKEMRFNGIVGFIDSVTYNLFEPQNTTITITNYKDKFEDLFQKITQAAVAIQNKEYTYDRVSNLIDVSNGAPTIKIDILKQSLENANEALSMSQNNDVFWDETGITIMDKNTNENGVKGQVKLTSGGIFTSNSIDSNGNYKWTSAITPNFINANLIRAGHLDTRSIAIWNDSEPRFMWNADGIFAYNTKNGLTNYDSYVKYNQDGLKFREYIDYDAKLVINNLMAPNNNLQLLNYQVTNATFGTLGNQSIFTSSIRNKKITYTTNPFKNLIKGHKYYYSMIVTPSFGINEETRNCYFNFYIGAYDENNSGQSSMQEFTADNFLTLDENGYIIELKSYKVAGEFIIPTDTTRRLKMIGNLSQMVDEWQLIIENILLIDLTAENEGNAGYQLDGSTLENLNWFPDTETSVESVIYDYETAENKIKIYRDAVTLDWDGLQISAQNDSVSLTAKDGLVIKARNEEGDLITRLRMGKYNDTRIGAGGVSQSKTYYGILGYTNDGIRCFSLDEDGLYVSGTIEASSGKIGGFKIGNNAIYRSIDGTITEETAYKNANSIYFGEKGISLGNNFSVSSEGILNAIDANISGKITANEGTIGGFTINDNSLSADSSGNTVIISPNGISLGTNFDVTANGELTATNVDITGTINAEEGTIGDFSISKAIYSDKNSLNSDKEGIYIGTEGISLGKNNAFTVEKNGTVTINGGDLKMYLDVATSADYVPKALKFYTEKGDYVGQIALWKDIVEGVAIWGYASRPVIITSGAAMMRVYGGQIEMSGKSLTWNGEELSATATFG